MERFEEKTEEPTAKRLKKARLEGHRPLSKEVVYSGTFLSFLLLLWFLAPKISTLFTNLFQNSFTHLNESPERALATAFVPFLPLVLGIGLALLIAHIAFYVVQRGFLFVIKREEGKRKGEGIYPFFLNLFKGLLIAFAFLFFISFFSKHFSEMTPLSVPEKIAHLMRLFFWCFLILSLVFACFSILDFLYKVWKWKKEVKMSREEIKEEKKESEGDVYTKEKFKDRR